jgi:3-hydroxyisobutyrate dehydrogenase-like beta-hydroxyacid dehydrogenase
MAAQAKKIFLCLPFAPEVEVALFGLNGVTKGAQKGLMIIYTSTIYVNYARAFQTRLKAFELSYSDCPISSLPFRAADGSLNMMFG